MSKKVTIEQIGLIIKHLQDGATGQQAARTAKVHPNTVKKIYDHVAQVGHYKTIRVETPLPAWQGSVRGRPNAAGKVTLAIEAALDRLGSATVTEILESMQDHGVATSRQAAYFILSGLYDKGRVHREGHPYVFTLSSKISASE